ncbi:integrin alpha FG-GAP repeat-containing protein 2 [Podila minutissima]|uniref:Integrin alpha FG-GAP repeat-containing protein 2 n=1 Tax=Podila minutissima TaxID=64525 RepID=A0A9P5VLV4_9FUNG|nr:integrin alpha FG-GAP repeat-containing protein 2 [Podila minutissima]
MPNTRHVSLVQKLRWNVSGNISPTAFAIGDVDGHGDNSFVIGNLVGELFIFKGSHPEGLPWMTCKGLGTITAVAIGDIRNWGKNSIVVMSAEGLCHIFDVSGLDEENNLGHNQHPQTLPFTAPGSGGGHTPSVFSSTPLQGSYQNQHQYPANSLHHSINPLHPNLPVTPSIRPVPDIHHHNSLHSTSHHTNHGSFSGTPPMPAVPHNTQHGSTSSSVSGFPHSTPGSVTPVHTTHATSLAGMRRGSEVFPGSGSASVRTTAALSNMIGTPPPSSASHGHGNNSSSHHPRSIGGGSALNSPTGTPHLRPQHPTASIAHSTRSVGNNNSSREPLSRKSTSTSTRHNGTGKTQVRNVGGRRVLERPNLTLPVPVNINRAHIADIDGDGLNELVLARTDRILHSYSLQARKAASPTMSAHPNNQPLNLMKLLSRTSSISTLDSSGLLSPSEDKRETVIHFPSLAPSGRQYHVNSPNVGSTPGATDTQDASKPNDASTPILALVEKRRWALDGQIHCLSVTKNSLTGLPVLLVAQPGLKFVMVDHTGVMSEPLTQIQRNPKIAISVGPDTPTRGAGGGDVATDIVCGTQYVNGQKKDIIGLMSMDGAFALHDLENNTVRVHDLDSTHKIFGFSKLNFGGDRLHRHHHYHHEDNEHHRRSGRSKGSSGYGRTSHRYDDETNGESDDDGLASDEDNDEDTVTESQSRQKHQGDGSEYTDAESRIRRKKSSRAKKGHQPSLLVVEPYGSRFQMNDMFVGCSWSGITFFIDQEFNIAQYDFDARVCAFGAGQYAVTPGHNEPCLFYVDFEDNIYVYYNLYIQTQPSAQFQDLVKADANLVKASQKMKQAELEAEATHSVTSGSELTDQISQEKDGEEAKSKMETWTEQDMRDFIRDSLYNVNRYEDEYQQLKGLAEIERTKRAAFYEAEEAKEREKAKKRRRAAETAAAAIAEADMRSSGYIDPRLRRPHNRRLSSDPLGASDGQERRHFPHEINTRFDHPSAGTCSTSSPQYTRSRSQSSQHDDHLHSPVSPTSPTSPNSRKGNEKRRSSLLIKDVLSHYEGQVTPPLKSPTSPTSSGHFSKGHRSTTSSGAGSASLTNIMKRLSLKDLENGGRLSRTSGASSSGSSGSGSSNTVIASHHLLGGVVLGKGKTIETRAGKSSLRVNRPVGVPRSRSSLGVMGRKLGAKSRLSHQQDPDDGSEEVDDGGLDRTTVTSDGTEDIEREQMLATIGAFDGCTDGNEADLGGQEYFNPGEGEVDHDDDTNGVYTPSTISPIPSPGRFYSSHQHLHGSVEPSLSLDGSASTLAKSLLSPSTKAGSSVHPHSVASGSSSSSRPSSRGHARHRSGHGLLDYGLGPLPTREIVASVGIGSGPNSAGHNSGNQDGRRSRAESVLSTGSDIGGVIVPDITLLASSFPTQSTIPLSTSEPDSHGAPMMPQDSDNEEGAFQEGQMQESEERSTVTADTGIRRPPRRAATFGSDGGGRGSGSGSDTATGKPGSKRNSGRLADGRRGSKGDVRLMPAPLPRSNQHYQRQQEVSSGSFFVKDPNPSHILFSTSTQGGGTSGIFPGSVHGPSSPLTANVNSANAILSNPSTNSYKGFGILSLPVTSPSGSTASTHQYFSSSHYPMAPGKSAAQPQHSHHPLSHGFDHLPEDDRMSIRSRASSVRGRDREDVDADSLLDHEGAGIVAGPNFGVSPRSSSSRHQHHRPHYAGSMSSVGSSSHLVSDSLVHRLEELQRQDHEQEEKQKRKQREKELEKERGREKEREKERVRERTKSTTALTSSAGPVSSSSSSVFSHVQQDRPAALSRANSGASVQSVSSHHHHHAPAHSTPSQPTSHGSSGRATHWGEEEHESAKRLKYRLGMGQGL